MTPPVPAYYRIYRECIADILDGRSKPGDRMPTEKQLAQAYGVSIGTVRKAMDCLSAAGYCRRVQGKGTFVALYSTDRSFFYRSRRDLSSGDLTIITEKYSAGTVPMPADAARLLGRQAGDPSLRIARVIGGRDESGIITLAWHESFLLLPECGPLLRTSEDDILKHSLYRLVERDCGLVISHCDEYITVKTEGSLPREARTALALPKGAPVLEMRMLSLSAGDIPFEYRTSYMPCDKAGIMRRHDIRS